MGYIKICTEENFGDKKLGEWTLMQSWQKNFDVFLATANTSVINKIEAWQDQNACSMSRNHCDEMYNIGHTK